MIVTGHFDFHIYIKINKDIDNIFDFIPNIPEKKIILYFLSYISFMLKIL